MDNIVNLKEHKNKTKETKEPTLAKSDDKKEETFKDIIDKNKKNNERIVKERLNINDSVKRSYRLKPNDPNNKR